ncbi:TonB-dependent receptor [Neokomagataea thailandica NBRC 106555]|uniref:TonB-dependent receptor n=1 Tax=Neokomagataea thailandica NBRC 106555 TaxID=1223520 RepID=A0ABQ0QRJ1_9PROT|nr:TonB-dependent receptor [Neokomagataea thailandica NBRC 106555]
MPAAHHAAPRSVNAAVSGNEQLIITARRTHSEQTIGRVQMQRELSGINPIKALSVLPGVVFNNADPWGNNEQNSSLIVHGFNQNQLGYTLDGIPLGDQAYGNYNGLSPQRAVISENVGATSIATGAGDLSTASTSNLGGSLQFSTQDPSHRRGAQVEQVFGSFSTFRTFARLDTGDFGNGNSAYVSFVRQDARSWDNPGSHQGGYQVNAKFRHDTAHDHLSVFFDWSDKVEPNEDPVTVTPNATNIPYTRPFLFPDLNAAKNYINSPNIKSLIASNNYRNYYGGAQREDFLAYAKWSHDFSENLHWDNNFYYHHNLGEGIIAGPATVAGLPTLFAAYYPGLNSQSLNNVFGGSGYATRTTEYWDNRGGLTSALRYHLHNHSIEVGGWYERNNNTQARRWYAFSFENPTTPYERQQNPLIKQYTNYFYTNTFVTHLQDVWQVSKNFSLMGGFKSTLVYTNGTLPVAALPGALSPKNAITVPGGQISTTKPFLPSFGATWTLTPHEQWFANIQQNVRSFQAAGYGNATPWGATSQAAFEDFRKNGKPETSWTYETGLREHRNLNLGPITGFEGQITYYHVHFSNRLLAIATSNVYSVAGAATILANVGSVDTNGVDVNGTIHLGSHFSLYDALSYNKSQYNANYLNNGNVVATAGKNVVNVPAWSNKFIASTNWGNAYGQFIGEYQGKRYTTFTNDMSTPSYKLFSMNAGYTFNNVPHVASLKVQGNITNLTGERGWSTVNAGAASGQYTAFPIAPRMFFLTVSGSL